MKAEKRIARKVGILYIIGTVCGILSVIFTGSLRADDYLTTVAANQGTIIMGTLFVLGMGLALTFIPPLLHPVFKKHHQVLSIAYIVFRSALESITYILSVIGMLLLVTLSRTYVHMGTPDVLPFQIAGDLLNGADGWINGMRIIVFGISALILNTILYRTGLVPRWIAVWGLAGAVLHLANGLLAMFGVYQTLSTVATLLDLPIGLQEMVMAVWLIVKGFNPKALEQLT